MICPNCNKEFIEHRETAYLCEDCGWLTQVDDKWIVCPEPVKPVDPELPEEPLPAAVPVRVEQPVQPEQLESSRGADRRCREYLGGIVTVTEIEDEENVE